jgi:hypothetical protein
MTCTAVALKEAKIVAPSHSPKSSQEDTVR